MKRVFYVLLLTEIHKTRTSYSKKQWIIDAIEEKLVVEKVLVQKKLSEAERALINS
jgi:hypothetical protein